MINYHLFCSCKSFKLKYIMKFLIALTLILTSFTYGASKGICIEVPIALKDTNAKLDTNKYSYYLELCNPADSSDVNRYGGGTVVTKGSDTLLLMSSYKPAKYLLKATVREVETPADRESSILKPSNDFKDAWVEIDLTNVTEKKGNMEYVKCNPIYIQRNK